MWKNELKSAYRSTSDLEFISHASKDFSEVDIPYKTFITKKFFNKINNSPELKKQYLPSYLETETSIQAGGLNDPIGDQLHLKTPGFIHRYHNRALFTPTTVCPILCRFCFRKNELNQEPEKFRPDLEKIKKYLKDHKEIEEIIFTGGDPLILDNSLLTKYLDFFLEAGIAHIRFHSKTPIHLPSRITEETVQILSKYKSLFKEFQLVIHCNHPDEIDQEIIDCFKNCNRIFTNILSQSVLLKDINDNPEILENLFRKLVENKIRPYYLHHPDKVKGAMHFYLSKESGVLIYNEVRKRLSGWMVPQYIFDSPEAIGKKQVIH